MNTRNWIIAAVAVVLLIAIYFSGFPARRWRGPRKSQRRLQLPSQGPGSVMSWARRLDTGNRKSGGRFSCREDKRYSLKIAGHRSPQKT